MWIEWRHAIICIMFIIELMVLNRSDATHSTLVMCQDDASGSRGVTFSLGVNLLRGGLHILGI